MELTPTFRTPPSRPLLPRQLSFTVSCWDRFARTLFSPAVPLFINNAQCQPLFSDLTFARSASALEFDGIRSLALLRADRDPVLRSRCSITSAHKISRRIAGESSNEVDHLRGLTSSLGHSERRVGPPAIHNAGNSLIDWDSCHRWSNT